MPVMPDRESVALGEARPAPQYPCRRPTGERPRHASRRPRRPPAKRSACGKPRRPRGKPRRPELKRLRRHAPARPISGSTRSPHPGPNVASGSEAEQAPGGKSGAKPDPATTGALVPFSASTPLGAEPLLQALATANSTVLEGLNAQMQARLEVEWDRVAKGRRSVEGMVEAGQKAHVACLASLDARADALAVVTQDV
uniref:Uncharacterized protein n=1 Tax=Oryza punctata TaxID=4537 RepID=A0A0E0KFK0_ORYPU